MTRKDYILIAEALRKAVPFGGEKNDIWSYTVDCFIDVLAANNPRFNRKHFLAVVLGKKALHSRPSRNGVQS